MTLIAGPITQRMSVTHVSAFHKDIIRQRHSTAEAALGIARELEAGRAVAPFQEKLTQLAGDFALPVRAAIIADQPGDLHALLSEIIGQDYNVCKVVVPSRLGFSEVLLQERGFLLDTGDGPREFDDSGSFLTALQQTHALQQTDDGSMEPLRLKLKGPAHLNGLCLLVPHSLDAMVRKPALLSTLADQADWVFLAGNPGTTFTPEQRATIQLVLEHVTGLQNVLHPADPAPATTTEWWKGWTVTLSLGLVRTGTEPLRSRLAFLTAPDSELRQYLVETRRLRQLETTLLLMNEEIQQSQRQLGNRANLAKDGLVGTAAAADLRKTAESLRTRLTEELESLTRAIERDTKVALAPDGAINRRLRDAAFTLEVDDIEQTPAEVAIKLTLAPETSERLTASLLAIARERLASDHQQLQEGFDCSLRDIEKSLEVATGARHKLALEMPDEAALWDQTASVARPEMRYRGEMPRPTLLTRLSAARQGIMSLMIAGTILGGAGALTGDGDSQGIRTTLYALMLPLLIVGFLWTYVSFRKKERLTIEKEVEKLQEGVFGELRRVLQELLREQQAGLAAALQKNLRTAHQQVDAALDRLDKQRQREAEEARRRQTEQQRTYEQRGQRMRQFGAQLSTLQSQLAEARKIQARWLGDWIQRFNQGKV